MQGNEINWHVIVEMKLKQFMQFYATLLIIQLFYSRSFCTPKVVFDSISVHPRFECESFFEEICNRFSLGAEI